MASNQTCLIFGGLYADVSLLRLHISCLHLIEKSKLNFIKYKQSYNSPPVFSSTSQLFPNLILISFGRYLLTNIHVRYGLVHILSTRTLLCHISIFVLKRYDVLCPHSYVSQDS